MRIAALTFILVITAQGCGKKVFLDGGPGAKASENSGDGNNGQGQGQGNTGNGENTSLTRTCAEDKRFYKKFEQPEEQVNRSVDLVFVLDSSSSLDTHRSKLVNELDAFTSVLDSSTDFRIGVILGHGGASRYSGSLYQAHSGDPAVLNSNVLSLADIRQTLVSKVSRRVSDVDEANGEALLYSFSKALDRLPALQQQGILRPNASWSFIFVTDENDICFPPQFNGFTTFPDYVPSVQSSEVVAYRRYCIDRSGGQLYSTTSIAQRIATLHPGYPISLGGVIHHVPIQVPQMGEQSIGHGVLELLKLHNHSTLISLADSSYRDGLKQLATQAVTNLNLLTVFLVGEHLDERSIVVVVDQKAVPSHYEDTTTSVRIDSKDAGGARSIIEIRGCKK